MTRELSHDEARAMLAAEALGALADDDRAALLAHLAGCEDCARELGSLAEAAGALALAAGTPPLAAEARARVRDRLLARVAADRGVITPPATPSVMPPVATPATPLVAPSPDPSVRPLRRPIPAAPPARFTRTQWLAAASIVIVATGVSYYALQQRDRNRRLEEQVQAMASARDALQQDVRVRDSALTEVRSLLSGLTGPGVQVIDAKSPGIKAPSARMFWDQATNRWTFIAHHLPAVDAGHTYQLWLITRDQHKVSAGTFAVRPEGDALVRATYALPRDSLAAVAVTQEPTGGSPQPTTQPLLVGVAGK